MFSFSYKENAKSPNECRVFHKNKFEKRLLLNSNSSKQQVKDSFSNTI